MSWKTTLLWYPIKVELVSKINAQSEFLLAQFNAEIGVNENKNKERKIDQQ